MRRETNFTLLELLIVSSIIGILVTLLLPSLQRARKVSMEVVCLSNQMQLYVATSLYSSTSSSNIVPLGQIKDSWDARRQGRIGVFGLIGMQDTPSIFHCPLLNTENNSTGGHNMDIKHPNGAGMSWYNDSSVSRIIVGYNIRSLQWYKFNGGREIELQNGEVKKNLALKFSDDPNTILFHDVLDDRVGIKYHHLDNYNVVKLDGSGKKIYDKGMVVDNMVPYSFDGWWEVGDEQTTYEYLESR